MLIKKFKAEFEAVCKEFIGNKTTINVEEYVNIMEKMGFLFKPSNSVSA